MAAADRKVPGLTAQLMGNLLEERVTMLNRHLMRRRL